VDTGKTAMSAGSAANPDCESKDYPPPATTREGAAGGRAGAARKAIRHLSAFRSMGRYVVALAASRRSPRAGSCSRGTTRRSPTSSSCRPPRDDGGTPRLGAPVSVNDLSRRKFPRLEDDMAQPVTATHRIAGRSWAETAPKRGSGSAGYRARRGARMTRQRGRSLSRVRRR